MNLREILGRTFTCECGRTHEVPTRRLIYEEAALERLPEILASLVDRGSVLLVADRRTWTIAGEKQEGIIFKDGNVLSCGWSPKHELGVVAYLVKQGLLDGVWFEEQNTSLGNEILKGPATKDTLSGLYTITKGEMPKTKKKYGGSVDITIYKSGVYKLTWKLGSQTVKGLGLRSNHFEGSDTDVLSAGFNADGDAGVMQYIIYGDGKSMKGH